MRVFVSEYLCSGALADQALTPSLAAEGRAMWQAVIEDLVAIAGVTVTTTRDHRLPALLMSAVEELVAATPQEERRVFRDQCATADAVLVIAPEIEDQLSRRVALARYWSRGARIWNASLKLCRLASDKFDTWKCLQKHGIPTVPTQLLEGRRQTQDAPVVIKPRFGAGSQDTFLCRTSDEMKAAAALFTSHPRERQGIVQPYVAGRSLSCLMFVNRPHQFDVAIHTFCPPGEQRLSDDGRFQYLGATIPAAGCGADRVHRLISQALEAMEAETRSRVEGPLGFDLLESADSGELLVVDINPRFTTSYIACRRLAEHNLLAPMLGVLDEPVRWRAEPVTSFVADIAQSG